MYVYLYIYVYMYIYMYIKGFIGIDHTQLWEQVKQSL